ncbi:hypothetical protein C3K47_01410 [Solitalea longa]|uniref:Uncharacterized protein n=1 Tax=Solitalea longa TaxID=2079460 RepID=A0A2S5A9B2_9SPHI|nr:hypothetical protein [Solitalea longa]POY39181.1 hypothetical protein C3K47_01410 [Solitalea longa]
MNRITEEQLWDLADGLIPEAEAAELIRSISMNPKLKQKFEEIKAINASLASTELETPSPAFTANVMTKWRAELAPPVSALKTLVNRKIIYGVAAIFAFLIVGLLFFAIGNAPAEPSTQYVAASNQVQGVVNSQVDSLLGNRSFWFGFFIIDAVLLLIFVDKLLSRNRLLSVLHE